MNLTPYHPNVSDDGLKVLTRIVSLLIPKRTRKYDLTLVVAAILDRTDNGTKWRAMDRAELPWHVAYDYYRRWARDFVIETANAMLVSTLRFLEAFHLAFVGAPGPTFSHAHPTLVAVDSRSVASGVWGQREAHGFDGFKHVKGVKIHAATDARGHLLACCVSGANAHDGPWAARVLARVHALGFTTVVKCLADGAYAHFADAIAALGIELECTTVPEWKKLKANGFVPIPVRWVIERTFAQLSFARGFRTSFERVSRHAEATVMWAHAGLTLRQLQKL